MRVRLAWLRRHARGAEPLSSVRDPDELTYEALLLPARPGAS
jgi:hypothetical protein